MAHKRMFSKDITGSDAFREMPPSSQALYFHLGMEADDDGFLDSYKNLMRGVNATNDDLGLLVAKRFLIVFPSKVIVVKHWKIHNTVRKDRYHPTKHSEEKQLLVVKENGSYTELNGDAPVGLPNGNQMATEYRIEENRKDTADADFSKKKEEPHTLEYEELLKWAEDRRGFPFTNRVKQYAALKKARIGKINRSRLKDRWQDCEGETWRDGFDWTSVVSSFDKKA